MTPTETLIARIEAHETEQTAIFADMETLGLDDKAIKKIRRAQSNAKAAQMELEAMLKGPASSGQPVEAKVEA